MTVVSFLLRRASRHWQLLLSMSLGVILATAFLASGPVLLDTIFEFGLRRTLVDASRSAGIMRLTARASQADAFAGLDELVLLFLLEHLDNRVESIIPSGQVGQFYPWRDGLVAAERRLGLRFYGRSHQELGQHSRLTAGTWPGGGWMAEDVLAVVVSSALAAEYDLAVGDVLPVSLTIRAGVPDLQLVVMGIMAPISPQDPYWFGAFSPFHAVEPAGEIGIEGVYVPAEDFFDLASAIFPSLGVSYAWQALLALEPVTYAELDAWLIRLGRLEQDLQQLDARLQVGTRLPEILADYARQADLVRAPLYLLIGIVVLMALYYLVMMGTLSLERVQPEFAMLRSRGASQEQIYRLQVVEALFVSGAALLSGPGLGVLLVRGLVAVGPLTVVAAPGWGLTLPQAAWLSALVAAAASAGSLLLPLPSVLRHSIITHQQEVTRVVRPPWWQRVYLDVFILGIGLVLLWRLRLYGGLLASSTKPDQVDWLILLAPLSLLVGSAAILLRIFPALLELGSRLAGRGRGLPAALAFWQVARAPKHITRLVLLLMLAMALGIFATSLNAALDQNERERARYLAGGDLRFSAERLSPDSAAMLAARPDVRSATLAWRTNASLDYGNTFPKLQVLAVDPDTFNAVAAYRDDFSAQPMVDLFAQMTQETRAGKIELPGVPVPGQPTHIGLWLQFTNVYQQSEADAAAFLNGFRVEVRFAPAPEVIPPVQLTFTGQGEIGTGRYYYEGQLPEAAPDSLQVVSLWFRNTGLGSHMAMRIGVDDLTIADQAVGTSTVIDDFGNSRHTSWGPLTFPLHGGPLLLEPNNWVIGLYFGQNEMSPLRWYGIGQVSTANMQPVPVLMSPAFQARTGLHPGAQIRASVQVAGVSDWSQITFKIVDQVQYFPTMYETQEAGYLVALRDPLLEQINLQRYTPIAPNELLLTGSEHLTPEDVAASGAIGGGVRGVYSAEQLLAQFKSHPLALGLRSVAWLGYLLTTVLSLAGFGSHFYLNTRRRSGYYGVLRALGLSPRQLYFTLLVEQVVLIFSGLILGTVLGLVLSELILAGLPLFLGEGGAVPPFVTRTDWGAVLGIYLTLTGVFIISLGMATVFLWRVRIHRVVRIGEE